MDPLHTSKAMYTLQVSNRVLAFISVIQPKKRANTKSSNWYCDPGLIIGERSSDGISKIAVVAPGVKRQIHAEISLLPDREYVCLPFSCLCSTQTTNYPFRLSAYSSDSITITKNPQPPVMSEAFLKLLHQDLLSKRHKSLFPMGAQGALVCVHSDSCVYFLALNGSTDNVLSVKITVQTPSGLKVMMTDSDYDVPPTSQTICGMVGSDGRLSTATEFTFRYLVSVSKVASSSTSHRAPKGRGANLSSPVPLSFAADLVVSSNSGDSLSGGGTIETFSWIPQLGKPQTT